MKPEPKVEASERELRALAKLSLAMFIVKRQGVNDFEEIEKAATQGFGKFHGLDKDTVQMNYLQAMEALSRVPFVFCAIQAKNDYIDALLQNPASADQVVRFVKTGVENVALGMNFNPPPSPEGAEPDLIL